MIVKVKICGIRTLEQANAAINAGADFLGFNFVPTSKRYINPNDAKKIINQIRIMNHESRIRIVGVFQNEQIDEVNRIEEMLDLDFIQLHGEEDEEYIKKIRGKIIKKIDLDFPAQRGDDKVKYFLLDRKIQGKGEMVDLEKAEKLAKKYSIFFSGGLTADNVREIVSKVKPYAVDVASGIETDGQQDLEKIKSFIKTAKEVNI